MRILMMSVIIYSRVGDILFEYYDQTYGEFYNMSTDDDTKALNRDKIQISNNLNNLKIESRDKKKKKPRKRRLFTMNKNSIMKMVCYNDINDSTCLARLEDEYLTIIDKDHKKQKVNMVICPECDTERIYSYNYEQLICPNPECSIVEYQINIPNSLYDNTNIIRKGNYPYQRDSHFIEKLKQFLCMDATDIPEHVYDVIKSEMVKHKYTTDDITVSFIAKSLKRNKLSKYYDNNMYIYCKLKGVNHPTIKYSEYVRMIKMFRQVNKVYEDKFKPKNRNNFLRYSLLMYSLFIVIGKREHAQSLKLLKNQKMMKEQFNIISKIFKHLGWENDSNHYNFDQLYIVNSDGYQLVKR